MHDYRDDWNHIADHWDRAIADGNDFQKTLIIPTTDHLLKPLPGQRILDACCGNGNYARRLGRNGSLVTAFDGSSRLIELAKLRHRPEHGTVDYHSADACIESEVLAVIGDQNLDAAVCSMAMMDLPTLGPLLSAVRKSLKPGCPFVFSVAHPAFHSNEPLKYAHQNDGGDDGGNPSQVFGLIVTRYLSDWPHPSRGLLDQPRPHMLFHRPLSTLLRECFQAGFALTALEEPAFPADTRLRSPFTWSRRPEIPPALVVRLH